MIKTITTKEIKESLDNNKDFLLVDVLASNSFEARHIPGAESVPYSITFVQDFEKAMSVSKDKDIVVYCASSGCQLSTLAANALDKTGYTNVSHFVDGLAGWMQEGHKFEGEAA